MRYFGSFAIVLLISIDMTSPSLAEELKSHVEKKGRICRMEQQCHWVNFKKICTYVKVCR